jgi:ubiquinone/menaquinone biosynthesis C-methylase UbiE
MTQADSIFEASVGTGIIPTILRTKGWQGKYLGSDYTKGFLEAAKLNNPKEEFIEVDLLKPINLPDKSYDVSVVHHGIEYVYPYEPALWELKRISKKYVCISMWVPLGNQDNIRFNEAGNWNVNFYDKTIFLATLIKVFGDNNIAIKAEVKTEDGKINYWYILKV